MKLTGQIGKNPFEDDEEHSAAPSKSRHRSGLHDQGGAKTKPSNNLNPFLDDDTTLYNAECLEYLNPFLDDGRTSGSVSKATYKQKEQLRCNMKGPKFSSQEKANNPFLDRPESPGDTKDELSQYNFKPHEQQTTETSTSDNIVLVSTSTKKVKSVLGKSSRRKAGRKSNFGSKKKKLPEGDFIPVETKPTTNPFLDVKNTKEINQNCPILQTDLVGIPINSDDAKSLIMHTEYWSVGSRDEPTIVPKLINVESSANFEETNVLEESLKQDDGVPDTVPKLNTSEQGNTNVHTSVNVNSAKVS